MGAEQGVDAIKQGIVRGRSIRVGAGQQDCQRLI